MPATATLVQGVKFGLGVALLYALPVHGQDTAAPAKAVSQIARDATPATVTIFVLDGRGDTTSTGSGFLVRADGVVVTNWHVLEGATSAHVRLANGEIYERVHFLDGDSIADIALLKIPGHELPFLRPRSSVPTVGERVVAIGSPRGLSRTVTEGIVSASRLLEGKQFVQITAPISPGSSGAAVLDDQGRVFAVATASVQGGQSLNFAVPIRYALGLLNGPLENRPLAEVFRPSAQTLIGAAASLAASDDSAPRRISVPRPSVAGSYFVTQRWISRQRSAAATEVGLLVGTDRVGVVLLAKELGPDSIGAWRSIFVNSLRTNLSGLVTVDIGGMIFDGYQTEDGFYLEGEVISDGEPYDVEIEAELWTPKLSGNSGLFSAHTRTWYYTGNRSSSDPVEWTGEIAIAKVGDEILLDLALSNSAGGTSFLSGRGTIKENGAFTIESPDKRRTLKGHLRAGILSAEWTDRRDGKGRFSGQLRAVRK